MITAVDWSVGQIVDAVKRRGMFENSLFIWTSDNGGPEYFGGGGNNFPYRGAKVSNYEGGVRGLCFSSELYVSKFEKKCCG